MAFRLAAFDEQAVETYDVLWYGDLHWLIGETEDGDDLSHTVRSVVEEEESITVYEVLSFRDSLAPRFTWTPAYLQCDPSRLQ